MLSSQAGGLPAFSKIESATLGSKSRKMICAGGRRLRALRLGRGGGLIHDDDSSIAFATVKLIHCVGGGLIQCVAWVGREVGVVLWVKGGGGYKRVNGPLGGARYPLEDPPNLRVHGRLVVPC